MGTDVKPNEYFMIKLRCARCGVERTSDESPEDFKIDIATIYNGTTKLAMSGDKSMGKLTAAVPLNYKIRI
jgi:hypothetical protein